MNPSSPAILKQWSSGSGVCTEENGIVRQWNCVGIDRKSHDELGPMSLGAFNRDRTAMARRYLSDDVETETKSADVS